MAQGDPRQSFKTALRRLRSRTQQTRRQIAAEVLRRVGLEPATVRDALRDAPHEADAGLAQAIYHDGNPDQIHAAAAWTGLLTRDHSMLAFHVEDGGPDSLYKFSLSGGGDDARKTLDAFQVTQRVLLPSQAGMDVLVFDAGRRLRNHVSALAEHLGTQVSESEGTGLMIGSPSGDAAQAREHYRTLIKRFESGRDQPPNVPDAVPAGTESADVAA